MCGGLAYVLSAARMMHVGSVGVPGVMRGAAIFLFTRQCRLSSEMVIYPPGVWNPRTVCE